LQVITRLDRVFAKAEEILLALLLVGMVLQAALQVLLRNIWDTGIDWADITLQNVTVLVGLLGAAIATSEGRHLNIDIFSRVLKGRSKVGLRVVIGLFSVVICVLLARGGWTTLLANYGPWVENIPQGWSKAHNLRVQFLEGSIPQWLSLSVLPVGFALIGFHFFLRLVRDAGTLLTGTEWEQQSGSGAEGDAVLDEMTQAEAVDGDAGTSSEGEAR